MRIVGKIRRKVTSVYNQQVNSMTHSQEARVSSSQDSLRLTGTSNNVSATENARSSSSSSSSSFSSATTAAATTAAAAPSINNGSIMASLSGNDENSIESTFPWLKNFNADCRKAVGCKSVKLLENLLTVYLQHISVDVKNCYLKPNRGSKLRKCMLEALLFFHMYYQEVKEPMVFQFYFMKMADLISMYLDMEIIAARRKKETTKKVVGRITSCLHVFLDKQISYMLDVVLKAKTATRANKELYTPVLGKLMTNIRLTPRETQLEEDLMYVRCLLAFKLWKKMCKSNDEKKKVTELALQKLTVPKDFLEKSSKTFASVLPRIPHKKRNSITLFFMQAKFNLKPACEEFMNVCLSSPSPDDKHMFFDQLDESPSIGVKADVAPRTGNLLNSLWTSISVVSRSNGGDKGRADVLSGKKQKSEKSGKKVKKSKIDKNLNANIEGTNKKKKKVKNKTGPGEAISVFGNIPLLAGKEVKKKKKKAVIDKNLADTQSIQEEHVSSEQQVVEIKIEENGQEVGSGSSNTVKEVESRGMNQVNEINSVGYVGEVAIVEQKDKTDERQSASVTIPVEVETPVPDASNQVNQINSVCSESQNVESEIVVTKVNNGASSVSQNLRNELGVVLVHETKSQEERHLPSNCDDIVLTSVVNVNKINDKDESVIVPSCSSTKNSLVDCLVNTSQKPQPTATIENEAVPSTLCQVNQENSSTDMVAPRIIHPCLVQAQTSDGNDATNIVPQKEATLNVCDSSIKLEDTLQEQSGCVPVVSSVPIPDEGCGGVDNDFNRICPIEYDSDSEILSDLTQRRSIPEEERELILVRNERDLLPRDSVTNNIFATENADLLIEALGDVLPVSSIDLDKTVENVLLCTSEEGTQFESPPIDPINENEKRSLEFMVNSIRSTKDTGFFANYGTERQQVWLRSGSEHKFLFSNNCDQFFGSNPNYYSSMLPVHENALATSSFMDEDDDVYGKDDGYDREISSDEEVESVHEYNSSSTSSSPRMKMSGGKIGSHNLLMSVSEKDVLNSSSSNISDSPPILKNMTMTSGVPFKKSTDNTTLEKQRIVEKNPPPLSIANSPVSPPETTVTTSNRSAAPTSTLKNLNVNLTKCTNNNAVNTPKKVGRTPKHQSVTNSRDCKGRSVNVVTNRFPDVVRDAQNATQNNDKDTTARVDQQKKPQGTIPSESGKSVNNNIPGFYRHNPEMENRCIVPSIPYPTVPLPSTISKMQIGNHQEYHCTCSVCYFNCLAYLNYNAPQGADAYRVPVQYHESEMKSNMERLKSQDEELLRRIEASLADSKYSNSVPDLKDDEKVESKHKNVDSSLPLKKRLKTLTQIEETKVKSEVLSTIKSSQADSFPSYPIRPMISIAELQLDKPIINKVQNETKSIRAPVACMQKYPQYSGSSSYYNNTFNHNRDNYFKRMYDAQFEQCRQYPTMQSEISKDSPVCKVENSEVACRPLINGMPISNSDSGSVDRKPVITNRLDSSRNENVSVEYSDHYHNLKNNVQTQNPIFKTPVQLKEIVPASRECNVLKSENSNAQMPSLIPIVSDTSSINSSASNNATFISIKQEGHNMEKESKHVLDLSKQSQRGSRQKRNTSDVKPRKSKRIKRDTVIHNPDLRGSRYVSR